MGQNALGQSDCRIFKSTDVCLKKKVMKKPVFLHVDTDSWKLKVDRKLLGWAKMTQNRVFLYFEKICQ